MVLEGNSNNFRQLVDWSASVWAGLVAGTAFLLFNVVVTPLVEGGNAWIILRLFASPLLGQEVLSPPATNDPWISVVGTVIILGCSVPFSMVLALIIHRWGSMVGILGGAVFGLVLYCINFYTLTFFVPWFFAMRSFSMAISHLLFGAVAGWIYESLEVEEFIRK